MSSPDSWMKSGPSTTRCCAVRASEAVASLTPTMFLQLVEPLHRLDRHVDDRTRRDVVDDDRDADRVVDRLEVLVHPLLRGLVVIRRDDEHAVGTDLLRMAGELERLDCVVRAGAGDHARASLANLRRRRSRRRDGARRARASALRPSCRRARTHACRFRSATRSGPRRASSSSLPALNGVTSAVIDPKNLARDAMTYPSKRRPRGAAFLGLLREVAEVDPQAARHSASPADTQRSAPDFCGAAGAFVKFRLTKMADAGFFRRGPRGRFMMFGGRGLVLVAAAARWAFPPARRRQTAESRPMTWGDGHRRRRARVRRRLGQGAPKRCILRRTRRPQSSRRCKSRRRRLSRPCRARRCRSRRRSRPRPALKQAYASQPIANERIKLLGIRSQGDRGRCRRLQGRQSSTAGDAAAATSSDPPVARAALEWMALHDVSPKIEPRRG